MNGHDIALGYKGLHEVKDTSQLRKLFTQADASINIDPSNAPWCAAFINACEKLAGKNPPMKLNARSFLQYGAKIDLKNAKRGDIVIFSRGGSTWQGHVAYLDGIEPDGIIRTLGGNQSDSVSIGWYRAERLLGVRRS